ncbi:MAG: transglycosylase SLT domain-containing protein [Desulfovibrio sp.]
MRLLYTSLLCGLVVLLCLLPDAHAGFNSGAGRYTDRYDADIKKAVARWWKPVPEGDWRWLKAQLYQESLLDPMAVSHVGAAGLGQFMPGTWKDVSQRMGWGKVSPHSAKHSIMAAAMYMRDLRNQWRAKRPELDRMDLARACYNAGLGNILKAQKAAGGANRYEDIIQALPQVTGHHSKETITYVKRIHRWYKELICSPR